MPSFGFGFIRPGVYVEQKNVVIPNPTPGSIIPAIIGTGTLNKTVSTDSDAGVERTVGQTYDTFTDATAPVVATLLADVEVVDQNSVSYTNGVDFDVVLVTVGNHATYPNSDVDDWVISWLGSTKPEDGNSYFVTWDTPKVDDDFLPLFWDDLARSIVFNGEADPDNDGIIENSLSGGAQIVVDNGAGEFWTVQIDPRLFVDPLNPTSAELYTGARTALVKLENVDCYAIVPMLPVATTLPDSTALITALKNHVTNMSSILARKERIAIVGVPANTDTSATPESTVYAPLATSLNTSRMCVVCPSSAKITLNTTQGTVDGSYIAAAIAGIICNGNVDAGEPVTGKVLASFDEIKDRFNDLQKAKLGNAGVMMCLGTPEVPLANIILDLTTKPTSIIDSSIKIQRINDVITKTLRTTLHRLYINTRNLGASTLSSILASVQTLLLQFATQNVIVEFRDLKVTVNSLDPRQVDVEFKIKPSFEVNYIFVKFTTVAF